MLQILQARMELSCDSRWSEHELIGKDSEASKYRADLRVYSPLKEKHDKLSVMLANIG